MAATARALVVLACVLLWTATAFAVTLSGTVTNRTTGKPSPGDKVAVIDMAESMKEVANTTTDAQGHFQVNAPDDGQILLRVTHRGADYSKTVEPGITSAQVDVYDSATRIDGIGSQALVLRAETDASGKTLNLAENFFVQNASAPPRTELGGSTFDFYLPKGAHISQTLASTPGGEFASTPVKTLDAAKGHYAFTFPLHPGETRFQVVYSLPYNGQKAFSLKLPMQTGDVAVMLPTAMQFQGSAQFQPLPQDVGTQTFDAHEPVFGQPVEFSIAGSGQLPQAQNMAGQPGSGGAEAASESRPGGGMAPPGDPDDKHDPWAEYKWWILGALAVALVIGAGTMLKTGLPTPALTTDGAAPPDASVTDAAGGPPSVSTVAGGSGTAIDRAAADNSGAPVAATAAPSALLLALKDELFELEADRLAGRLSEAEYAEHKAALDLVLRRALGRIGAAPTASNG